MRVYVLLRKVGDMTFYCGSYGSFYAAKTAMDVFKNPGYGPLPLGEFFIGSDLIEPEPGQDRFPCTHEAREIVGCLDCFEWCGRCGGINDGYRDCREDWRWPTYAPPGVERAKRLASEPEAKRHD
jgi:hypothetical protein